MRNASLTHPTGAWNEFRPARGAFVPWKRCAACPAQHDVTFMQTPGDASTTILLSALDGDKSAQQVVFAKYADLIASVARSCWPDDLRGVTAQDDLSQEIVKRALEKLHTFDRRRLAEFPGWLKKVATSVVLDEASRWRAYGHKRLGASPIENSSSDDLLERVSATHSRVDKPLRRDEAKAALAIAIQTLPADQREAIERKYFADEGHDAIAAAMNRSVGAVRELLRRAESRLEAEMGTPSQWLSG